MAARKVALIVIDGWGVSSTKADQGNAIAKAETPVMDRLFKQAAYSELEASGEHVGLPAGLMGNSEVGHLNIGAGQVVYQDIGRIAKSIREKTLWSNDALKGAFDHAKSGTGRLHFLGLLSDGGVHSHQDHLEYMLEGAKKAGVANSYVHAFMDGRDTPPHSGKCYLDRLLKHMHSIKYGKLATATGRFYAMDRDSRWDRIALAYEALLSGTGEASKDVLATMAARYEAKETDEFIKPIIVDKEGCIKDGDALVFFDFRADRMREIVAAIGIKPQFEPTTPPRNNLYVACMTQYKAEYPFPVLFPKVAVTNVLAEWLSSKGLTQYHTAETEKYAHVTFFFNGGREIQFDKEKRELVPSPQVKTYDLKPEMAVHDVAISMLKGMKEGHDFVMCNLAPPDMVGHTGVYDAAVKAVQETDTAIGTIEAGCLKHDYTLMITADHGNAEKMYDDNGKPFTAHTTALVPFVMKDPKYSKFTRSKGILADVAPTVLKVMGVDAPAEMTGKSMV